MKIAGSVPYSGDFREKDRIIDGLKKEFNSKVKIEIDKDRRMIHYIHKTKGSVIGVI